MLERKTVSQCPTSDYCRGWNDAVDAIPKWISVEKAMPDLCIKVIVAIPLRHNRYRFAIGERWSNFWWADGGKFSYVNAAKWLWCSIPEPPKEG